MNYLEGVLGELPTTVCVEWPGYRDRGGYGTMTLNGRHGAKAHRVVYELVVGQIPDGLTIDHLCRNRACVNPDHLDPVTLAENNRRGKSATKPRCVNGHLFDEANTYRRKANGRRFCRACGRQRQRESRARRSPA